MIDCILLSLVIGSDKQLVTSSGISRTCHCPLFAVIKHCLCRMMGGCLDTITSVITPTFCCWGLKTYQARGSCHWTGSLMSNNEYSPARSESGYKYLARRQPAYNNDCGRKYRKPSFPSPHRQPPGPMFVQIASLFLALVCLWALRALKKKEPPLPPGKWRW